MRASASLLLVAAVATAGLAAATPRSSVGGPLTLALFLLVAALAIGMYAAWTSRKGVLGWLLSCGLAIVGAVVGNFIAGVVLVGAHSLLKLDGSLMSQPSPLVHVILAIWIFAVLQGAWSAVRLMPRSR